MHTATQLARTDLQEVEPAGEHVTAAHLHAVVSRSVGAAEG